MVLICKIGIKYQYASHVESCSHNFPKLRWCVLIGACGLIRMNTVYYSNKQLMFSSLNHMEMLLCINCQ